jgi:hypothetical protein
MTDHDDEPELSGYEPIPRRTRPRPAVVVMRVVVLLAIAGLVLPGILVPLRVASATAENACSVYIAMDAPGSVGQRVAFELWSPIGPGWNCYSVAFGGHETLVKAFGLIPVGFAPERNQPEPSDS